MKYLKPFNEDNSNELKSFTEDCKDILIELEHSGFEVEVDNFASPIVIFATIAMRNEYSFKWDDVSECIERILSIAPSSISVWKVFIEYVDENETQVGKDYPTIESFILDQKIWNYDLTQIEIPFNLPTKILDRDKFIDKIKKI